MLQQISLVQFIYTLLGLSLSNPIMVPKVEKIADQSYLGEGPYWDIDSQSLFFVDCFDHPKLLKYVPSTKQLTSVSVGQRSPSFIIPVSGQKNQFLVAFDNELEVISWDGQSDNYTKIETLAKVEDLRFNDGKCDSTGRLWSGTMFIPPEGAQFTKPVGSIYSLEKRGTLKKHADQIKVSNGFAFNDAEKKLYYIDSQKRTIDQFDFEVGPGTIANRRILFNLDTHSLQGVPDGLSIDSDGNLWVALFDGHKVIKIDGRKDDTLLATIDLPAKQITSTAWGGPNLDELYVTSGAMGSHGGGNKLPPPHGETFRITGTGSKGLPASKFKFN